MTDPSPGLNQFKNVKELSEEEQLKIVTETLGLTNEDLEESKTLFLDFGNALMRDYDYPFTGSEADMAELGLLSTMMLYIEMAWADGVVQDEESALLGAVSVVVSLTDDLPHVPFVIAGMLKRRPDPEIFALALKIVALSVNKAPDLIRAVITEPFADTAYRVAKCSGGFFNKVDESEKEVLRKFFSTINFGQTPLIEKIKRKVKAE